MIAIDTNLLVYAFHPAAPEHGRARAAILEAQASAQGWGFTLTNAVEFWSVATRSVGGRSIGTTAEAGAYLLALLGAGASLWQGQTDFGPRLLGAAQYHGVAGRRIYDLQIGLLAIDNGASEMWTHDDSFVRLPGLWVRDPLTAPRNSTEAG